MQKVIINVPQQGSKNQTNMVFQVLVSDPSGDSTGPTVVAFTTNQDGAQMPVINTEEVLQAQAKIVEQYKSSQTPSEKAATSGTRVPASDSSSVKKAEFTGEAAQIVQERAKAETAEPIREVTQQQSATKKEEQEPASKSTTTQETPSASQQKAGSARQEEQCSQQGNQRSDPWSSLANYNPQLSIGMRTKRHFFPAGEELIYENGLLHTDECFGRRYQQHELKEALLLRTANIDKQIHEAYHFKDPGKTRYKDIYHDEETSIEARFFIWHTYYQPRWNYNHINIFTTEKPNEPVVYNSDDQYSLPKWTPTTEFPVGVFEEDEKAQICEIMIEKIAVAHHQQNYERFAKFFGADVVQSPEFAKYFFTIDPEEGKGHPVTMTGGILDTIKATDIEALSAGDYGHQFFENQVQISPNKIVFSTMQQLMVEKKTFEVKNTSKKTTISVHDIFSSSPEVLIFTEDGVTLPHRLRPSESIKVTVVVIPETLELLEAAVFVVLNPKYVFMLPVSIYVTNNAFNLAPRYYTNVNINEVVKTKIEIYNPYNTPITIQEAYSTEDFVALQWPNGKEIDSEETYSKDYSKLLTIQPGMGHTVLVASFQTDQVLDHHALVHLMLDTGHIMRLPLYYHVYTDVVKFLPSIVDFGVVPINFDAIKIPVSLKIRNGPGIKMLFLTQVMLPLNDVRLDFVMGEWDRDKKGHTQVFNKHTKRMETHRYGHIYADEVFDLMNVIMKPNKYGMIQTYIKLTFQQENGNTFLVELPIIGFVAPIHELIIERKGNNFYQHIDRFYYKRNPFYGFLPAEPLVQINTASYKRIKQMKSGEELPDVNFYAPMNVYGNFRGIATSNLEIINENPIFKFNYYQPEHSFVGSMETMQIGQFTVNQKDIYERSGNAYFWVSASHTIFPQFINISSQALACMIQEPQQQQKVFHCGAGHHFDFGQIGLYQSKQKVMNITNFNTETVVLDWANKTFAGDELSVSYKVSYHDQKAIYPELHPRYFNETESTEFLDRFTNSQRLGIYILPGHTVTLTFSLEGVIGSLKAGKASEKKMHAAVFSFEPKAYDDVIITYGYQVLPGGLSLLQNEIRFDPGFIGFEQSRELMIKSDFSVPVQLTSVHTTDVRVLPVIRKKVIEPGEETVIMDLIFEPGQVVKVGNSYLNDKKQTEQTDMMTLGQRKKAWKLSDMNISNFSTVISEALQTVCSDDVALWRSYQSHSTLTHPTWIDGDWFKGIIEDIHAVITIRTNIVGSIQIPVNAYVRRPQLTEARYIEFQDVQVGGSKMQSLELFNPFNETLYVNLFIGRNTVDSIDEVNRVNHYLQHEGQVELLKHVKGTQFEATLLNEIQSRLNNTRQFELYQQKLSRLPEIQKFCKNVRIQAAEKRSPVMHGNQQNTEDLQEQSLYQAFSDFESQFQAFIAPDMPYEIELKTDSDQEICELLHQTMVMMPEKMFATSTWEIINKYFAIRHQENLDLEALTNKQKIKEQNHLLANSTDARSLKEHLMFRLQEQLRNMYPDSLKLVDDVDIEIARDINNCSGQSPFMWDSQRERTNLMEQLAFPNPFKSGLLGFLTQKVFTYQTFTLPGHSLIYFMSEIIQTKTWSETATRSFELVRDGVTSFFSIFPSFSESKGGHQASRYVSSNFVDSKGRISGVNPAPALTRQWEVKHSSMHDEVLRTNGTVGVELLSQNFYIKPVFQGQTFSIPPNQKLFLEDAIIFEPRTLLSREQQMQMTLYLKSDKAVLQTLPLKGWASSAVLDVTQISKSVSFSSRSRENSTQILASYTPSCLTRLMDMVKKENNYKTGDESDPCLDTENSLQQIRNQIFGQSTIPQVINLHVHDSDVLNKNIETLDKGFFARLFSPLDSYQDTRAEHDQEKESRINQVILWDLSVINIGEIDFAVTKMYLEDPFSGEKSCYQDGVRLWPCIDTRINALKTKTFSLQFTSDFSVSEIRKTIVFESPDIIQRFPVQIEISAKALKYASEYINDDLKLHRPIFGAISNDLFSLMYLTLMATSAWVVYALIEQQQNKSDYIQNQNLNNQVLNLNKSNLKGQKALDNVQNVLASVTSEFVQNQYQSAQERFRSHQSIFLKECGNISQRKNQITLEHQRAISNRISKHQHALFSHKNPSRQTAAPQIFTSGGSKASVSVVEPGADSGVEQHSAFTPLDQSDDNNTEELMQKTFAPGRKNVPASKQVTVGGRTSKPQRVGKNKGNYSVDFQSKLMETTAVADDATSEALNQKKGNHDDSFTLVGQKEVIDDQDEDFDTVKTVTSKGGHSKTMTSKGDDDAQNQEQTQGGEDQEQRVSDDEETEEKKNAKVTETAKDNQTESDMTSEAPSQTKGEDSATQVKEASTTSQAYPTSKKSTKMSKQEEVAAKKRKAKYDLILKQAKIQKENQALAAEQAKKERERLRIIQQKEEQERKEKERQEQIRIQRELEAQKRKKLEMQEAERRAELERALHAQQKANEKLAEANQKANQNQAKQTVEPVVVKETSKKDISKEEDILDQVDNSASKVKEQSKPEKPENRDPELAVHKQKTPDGDSSFEQLQPQSLAQVDRLDEQVSESQTPKNKKHKRGISWGMSDRLTITNESENQSESNNMLDNSLTFGNERDANLKESAVAEPPQPVHETESSNTSFNTQPHKAQQQTQQPIRSVYQSKRQERQFQQKQYVAKQSQPSYGQTSGKRTDSQDPYSVAPSRTSYGASSSLYEEDTPLAPPARGKNSNQTIGQKGGAVTSLMRGEGRGSRRGGEMLQSEDDYRDTPGGPPYFSTRRGDRDSQQSYQVGSHREHYQSRAQGKQQRIEYDGGSDYESHHYKQGGGGTAPYGVRRGPSDRGAINDYYTGGQSTRAGYGDPRQQMIYQERRGGSYQTGGVSGAYGGRAKENLTRRKYEEQHGYMQHYSSGGSQRAMQRGEPPQYSGRVRDRQYFMAEEDEAYYDEMEYGHEDDVYGDEEGDFGGYEQRRDPGQVQADEDSRYGAMKKNYYGNTPGGGANMQSFYRKKPYGGAQGSAQVPPYGNQQYPDDHQFAGDGEIFNDEDGYEVGPMQHRRFQSRKDYEARQYGSQGGVGGQGADQSSRYFQYPQGSGYRRFAEEAPSQQPQQRYREKAQRQHPGSGVFSQSAQSNQQQSRYSGAPSTSARSGKQAAQASRYGSSIERGNPKNQDSMYGGRYEARQPNNGGYNKEASQPGGVDYSSTDQGIDQVSPRNHPNNRTQGAASKQYNAAQGNTNAGGSYKNKKLNYVARAEMSNQKVAEPVVTSQPQSNEMMSEQERYQPKAHQPVYKQKEWANSSAEKRNDLTPPRQAEKPLPPRNTRQQLIDSDDDDELIESTKPCLKTPTSHSSRRQSPDDDYNEEEEFKQPGQSQRNFFSNFKRIQSIFNSNSTTVPQKQEDTQDGGGGFGSGSLFTGSLFGGSRFDDYFQQDRQQQSLFGGNFFDNNGAQQDLHSFNPAEQQSQQEELQQLRKQPSSLEALRQSSRPLQAEQVDDYKYAAYTNRPQQTLFSNEGYADGGANAPGGRQGEAGHQGVQNNSGPLQFKKLEPFKPSKLLTRTFKDEDE